MPTIKVNDTLHTELKTLAAINKTTIEKIVIQLVDSARRDEKLKDLWGKLL